MIRNIINQSKLSNLEINVSSFVTAEDFIINSSGRVKL